MATKVRAYKLPPTLLIPNSPYPLLHYPGIVRDLVSRPNFKTSDIFDLFAQNGWQSQWVARYGPDIQSHYHSTTHEAMVVISGEGATIRFGVADAPDWKQGALGIGERGAGEEGGLEIRAALGDVFIVPAGVSHKTFNPSPETQELAFHQPDDIKVGQAAENMSPEDEARHRAFFEKVPVQGEFMQMGAYPYGGTWDFKVGGEHVDKEKEVWNVPKPQKDPILGLSKEGILGLWT